VSAGKSGVIAEGPMRRGLAMHAQWSKDGSTATWPFFSLVRGLAWSPDGTELLAVASATEPALAPRTAPVATGLWGSASTVRHRN
jgi:hypothetical protein